MLRSKLQIFLLIPVLLLLVSSHAVIAQELNTPAPSPKGTVTQIVGLTEVSISYSRPGVKGRVIFGDLEPYGELWRTGANKSTTIKFADDVQLGGKAVPAGEYALFTIPQKDEWTIIISKSIGWGTAEYKEEQDVARFNVPAQKLAKPVERLTIEIADMTNNSANIVVKWDRSAVSFALTCDTDAKVMSQIKQVMQNPPADDANVFYRAASYYFETDKDLGQALKWVDKSLSIKPDAFWMVRLKSRVQAKMGNYEDAIETARVGIETAKKANNEQYVKFNEEAIAEWSKKVN
jgi:tetratricopeptide (TPR) repeat protein